MIVYLESSAALSWLLGEPASDAVRAVLAEAEEVVTSRLTLAECGRGLLRAVHTGRVTAAAAEPRRAVLRSAAEHWTLYELLPEVLARVDRPFPVEPVRTLDALHLATLLELRLDVGPALVLALDGRVRANAEALGFEVQPA